MKKLIFFGAMALTMLAACQNEANKVISNENTETQKTASKAERDDDAVLKEIGAVESDDEISQYAAQAVEYYIKSIVSTSRIRSQIMCHGDYQDSISWTYVQVTLDGVVYHKLVRRYRLPGGGALTTVYSIDFEYNCNSTLFM